MCNVYLCIYLVPAIKNGGEEGAYSVTHVYPSVHTYIQIWFQRLILEFLKRSE